MVSFRVKCIWSSSEFRFCTCCAVCRGVRSALCDIKRLLSVSLFALQEAGTLRVSAPDGVWLPGSSGLCRPRTSAARGGQLGPQLFDSLLQWWVLAEPRWLILPSPRRLMPPGVIWLDSSENRPEGPENKLPLSKHFPSCFHLFSFECARVCVIRANYPPSCASFYLCAGPPLAWCQPSDIHLISLYLSQDALRAGTLFSSSAETTEQMEASHNVPSFLKQMKLKFTAPRGWKAAAESLWKHALRVICITFSGVAHRRIIRPALHLPTSYWKLLNRGYTDILKANAAPPRARPPCTSEGSSEWWGQLKMEELCEKLNMGTFPPAAVAFQRVTSPQLGSVQQKCLY